MKLSALGLAACALAGLVSIGALAAAPPTVMRTPSPSKATQPRPSPAASGTIVSTGPAQTRFGDLTVNFSEGEGNLKTGDFVMPSTVTGHSTDGNFRADRAFGNSKRDEITLVGHVLVHRLGGMGKDGKTPSEPVTLTCDKLEVRSKAKLYTATGNVKVVQGGKTLTAPLMKLDDNSHDAALTGGVHAEEPPDRSFDSAEVLYNTKSEDFKALGGVQATFPLKSSPSPLPSGTGTPAPAPKPSVIPSPKPSPVST
jgi:hypothetical protein